MYCVDFFNLNFFIKEIINQNKKSKTLLIFLKKYNHLACFVFNFL